MTYKTFADALSASPSTPKAANDNLPRKQPEPKYRGTLPALRWLHDNHPEVAEAMARAVKSLTRTTWDTEASDDTQEIRPTVGELINGATEGRDDVGNRIWRNESVEHHSEKDGGSVIHLGPLKFRRGELFEYGQTKKGRSLKPRDRMASRGDRIACPPRNTKAYVFGLGATTPSPLHADPLPRNVSGLPALASMYDPLPGVEANRALLRAFGVDGSVPFEDLPFPATKCKPAIADGAEFLGGVVGLSGTSSSGAVDPFDVPERQKGEAWKIVEEVASGATLKDIGERMGFKGGYAIRTAGAAIVDASKALIAANDDRQKKIAA